MSVKNINFDDKKIKKIAKIDDIHVNEILVSKKESYGTKYNYNDNDVIITIMM